VARVAEKALGVGTDDRRIVRIRRIVLRHWSVPPIFAAGIRPLPNGVRRPVERLTRRGGHGCECPRKEASNDSCASRHAPFAGSYAPLRGQYDGKGEPTWGSDWPYMCDPFPTVKWITNAKSRIASSRTKAPKTLAGGKGDDMDQGCETRRDR